MSKDFEGMSALEWWLKLPLVPIFFLVGCVVVVFLIVLRIVLWPWLLLYPECDKHPYDFGDDHRREAARRWRIHRRRLSLSARVASLFRGLIPGRSA